MVVKVFRPYEISLFTFKITPQTNFRIVLCANGSSALQVRSRLPYTHIRILNTKYLKFTIRIDSIISYSCLSLCVVFVSVAWDSEVFIHGVMPRPLALLTRAFYRLQGFCVNRLLNKRSMRKNKIAMEALERYKQRIQKKLADALNPTIVRACVLKFYTNISSKMCVQA